MSDLGLDREGLMKKLIEVDSDPFLQGRVYPGMIRLFTTGPMAGKTDPNNITFILLDGILEISRSDKFFKVYQFRGKLTDFSLVFTEDEELAREAMAVISPILEEILGPEVFITRIDEGIGLD